MGAQETSRWQRITLKTFDSWKTLASNLPQEKFCYGWLHRRLLRRYRPQSAVNCSTLWERAAGSSPNTSQVSLLDYNTRQNDVQNENLEIHKNADKHLKNTQTASWLLWCSPGALLGSSCHRPGGNSLAELIALFRIVSFFCSRKLKGLELNPRDRRIYYPQYCRATADQMQFCIFLIFPVVKPPKNFPRIANPKNFRQYFWWPCFVLIGLSPLARLWVACRNKCDLVSVGPKPP